MLSGTVSDPFRTFFACWVLAFSLLFCVGLVLLVIFALFGVLLDDSCALLVRVIVSAAGA